MIKPFIGVGSDVPADATVFLARHGSLRGFVLSEGDQPVLLGHRHATRWRGRSSTRRCGASSAPGARLDRIALLDNFCWPDPVQAPRRPDGAYKLAQLVRACRGLYEACRGLRRAADLGQGLDEERLDRWAGVKISVPPTLLVSAIGQIDDVATALTLEPQGAGRRRLPARRDAGRDGRQRVLPLPAATLDGEAARAGPARRRTSATQVPRLDPAETLPLLPRAGGGDPRRAGALGGHAGEGGLGVGLRALRDGRRARPRPRPGAAAPTSPGSARGRRAVLRIQRAVRWSPSRRAQAGGFERCMFDGLPCRRVGRVTADAAPRGAPGRSACSIDLDVDALGAAFKETLGDDVTPALERCSTGCPSAEQDRLAARGARADPHRARPELRGRDRGRRSAWPAPARSACTCSSCSTARRATRLADYQILAFIGGFAFGDHLGAGFVFANKIRWRLYDQLLEFIEPRRPGPGDLQRLPDHGRASGCCRASTATTARRARRWRPTTALGYRDAWVRLGFDPASPCVWTRGLERMDLPARHGEGKFLAESDDAAGAAARRPAPDRRALRRRRRSGRPRSGRTTPTARPDAVAGICDPVRPAVRSDAAPRRLPLPVPPPDGLGAACSERPLQRAPAWRSSATASTPRPRSSPEQRSAIHAFGPDRRHCGESSMRAARRLRRLAGRGTPPRDDAPASDRPRRQRRAARLRIRGSRGPQPPRFAPGRARHWRGKRAQHARVR